jgi:hypothetical protein
LLHSLCIPGREKSFQPPDERLQNLPKVAKHHGFKPMNMTGRKKHESRISNAVTYKTTGVKDIYISAMIQPVPKSKKERKSISRQVNLAISSPPATTEYL